MGISIGQFYDMSLREFYFALNSHNKIEEQKMEYNNRLQHVVARFQATLLLLPHIKNPIQDPRDLVKFSWEAEKVQSPEQIKSFLMALVKKTKNFKPSPAARKKKK